MPFVQKRVIDQGHDFDSLDLAEALLGDEGETGTSQDPKPDINPDDNKGGGSKLPRNPLRPLISGSGAVEEPIESGSPDDAVTRESFFPLTDPMRGTPRVPVGSLFES
ncbi:MAG TPA: hypothetical protein VMR28_02085 [Candidatus Saccharimonadales bacterium]|nr:hypothetical protein [Candidatus Saccharimonadales bacterium]